MLALRFFFTDEHETKNGSIYENDTSDCETQLLHTASRYLFPFVLEGICNLQMKLVLTVYYIYYIIGYRIIEVVTHF